MGNDLHIKAEEAREKEDFLGSLKLCDEATVKYAKENNIVKLAEVQASRALSLRQLAHETGNKNLYVLAKFAAKSGVKIIENSDSKNGIAIPLYTVAKCMIDLEKYDKAAEKIQEALEAGDETLSPAAIAEMKTRLAALQYRLGVDGAKSVFDSALAELESLEADDYTKKVWLSGAYMHMAEAMKSKGEDASGEIAKAEKIINSDDKLSIRRQQLEALKNK